MKQFAIGITSFIVMIAATLVISNATVDPTVKIVTPQPDYMTGDLRACLIGKLGVTNLAAFAVTEPPDYAPETMLYVYRVQNTERGETRAVSIQYGYDGTGSSVVIECWPPSEWQRWPMGVPSATPYLLPSEVQNGGTPVS